MPVFPAVTVTFVAESVNDLGAVTVMETVAGLDVTPFSATSKVKLSEPE